MLFIYSCCEFLLRCVDPLEKLLVFLQEQAIIQASVLRRSNTQNVSGAPSVVLGPTSFRQTSDESQISPAPVGLSQTGSPVPVPTLAVSRGARTSVISEQQSTLTNTTTGAGAPLQPATLGVPQLLAPLADAAAAGSALTTERTTAAGGGALVDLAPETDPHELFYRERAIARSDNFARATRFVQLASQYSAAALTIALRHPHMTLV